MSGSAPERGGFGLDYVIASDVGAFGEIGLRATTSTRPDWVGRPAMLHGGIAAMILDEAMGALGPSFHGEDWVTARLDVRYRAPVPLDGAVVEVVSWERARAPSIGYATSARLSHEGKIAVEARGLFVVA